MASVDASLVADLPMFAGLTAEELAEILREARSARYARNSEVFSQGEDAHSFFLLLNGHVRASKTTPTGEQVVMRYVSPGEIFGVAPAMGLRQYPATATAADDSVALVWPSAKLTVPVDAWPAARSVPVAKPLVPVMVQVRSRAPSREPVRVTV